MSHEFTFSPGVAPDVCVRNGRVHITYGHAPFVWMVFNADGELLEKRQQPLGYFPKTNGLTCLAHDGERFIGWTAGGVYTTIPGRPVGNNATGLSSLGLEYVQRQQDDAFRTAVYCGSVKVADYKPTGIWECYDNGSVLMMDDANQTLPWARGYVHQSHDERLVVAEGDYGVEGEIDGTRFTLWAGRETRWPRCDTDANLAAITAWDSRPSVLLWIGTVDELKALTPGSGAMSEHLNTVMDVRARYGVTLGYEGAWKVCNEVAWQHRAGGWGILEKPTGTNYVYDGVGYSVDVIINAREKQIVDILGSSELEGLPQWSVIPWNDSYAERWAAPIDPAVVGGGDTGGDDGGDVGNPEGTVEERLTYLEAMVSHLVETLRSV